MNKCCGLLFLCVGGIFAQTPAPPPLTPGEKIVYNVSHALRPVDFAAAALGAGIDHWRGYPSEWCCGAEAYAERFGNSFGKRLVSRAIQGGMQALDHEEPRRIHKHRSGFWLRTYDALKYTVIVRNDKGGEMLSYGRLIGDFGGGIVSTVWLPDRYHTLGDGLQTGAFTLGSDMAVSFATEFLPDLKRKLLHR